MKLADAVIKIMEKDKKNDTWIFVPFDRHDNCCDALELAGMDLYTDKYPLNKGRTSDCTRVCNALEKDERFEKIYVNHGTVRRGYRYKGGK